MNPATSQPTCPACGSPMNARTSKFGAFYGCSRYPNCKERIDANDAGKLAAAYEKTTAGMPTPQRAPVINQPIPAPLAQAIDYQAQIKLPGKRMPSQFAGTCACGAAFVPGALILWREGKVRGCAACGLGVQLELARLQSLAALPGRVKEELAKLTDEQREVAGKYRGGYQRLIASAGAGKTATYAILVAHLVAQGIDPKRILTMTFSRDGAQEMNGRLSRLFGPALNEVAVGTLHAFAGRWLERHYQQSLQGMEAVRIRNVLDGNGKVDRARFDDSIGRDLPRDPEQLAVQLLGVAEVPWLRLKSPLGVSKKPSYFEAKDYLRAVGWLTANIIAPESENVAKVEEQFGLAKLGEFYKLYFEALTALGVSVFDEWVYLAGKLARDEPAFSAAIAQNFDYVVCDESQDLSQGQLILAHKVAAAGKGNLLLIADVKQAVYEFRGAMPEFVLNAEQYVGRPVATKHLTANFRSVKPIIDLGNAIVDKAAWNIDPPAVPGRADADVPAAQAISIWNPMDTLDEGERVGAVCAAVMRSLPKENAHPRPLAVLSRTNGGLGPTEAILLREQVPYVISNGSGFFNRWEVRVAMSHLSLAAGVITPEIVKLACQAPSRNLGAMFARAVLDQLARNEAGDSSSAPAPVKRTGKNVIFAMRQVMQRSSRYASAGRAFTSDLEAIVNEPGIASQAMRACAYVRDHLKAKKAAESADADDNRLENLRVLSEIAVRFDDLAALVHYGNIGADARTDSNVPAVILSTVHRMKGREAPGVIIVSAFNGHFPHEKAKDSGGEERRIEYVAVTRARDRLVISTPCYDNRRRATSDAWMARLARRLLQVSEERDADVVERARVNMELRKAATKEK